MHAPLPPHSTTNGHLRASAGAAPAAHHCPAPWHRRLGQDTHHPARPAPARRLQETWDVTLSRGPSAAAETNPHVKTMRRSSTARRRSCASTPRRRPTTAAGGRTRIWRTQSNHWRPRWRARLPSRASPLRGSRGLARARRGFARSHGGRGGLGRDFARRVSKRRFHRVRARSSGNAVRSHDRNPDARGRDSPRARTRRNSIAPFGLGRVALQSLARWHAYLLLHVL